MNTDTIKKINEWFKNWKSVVTNYEKTDLELLCDFHAQFKAEQEEYKPKVEFYREQTEKLRKYIDDNNLGAPCQGFFDVLYDHVQELKAKAEQKQSAGVWVKASDKLPPFKERVYGTLEGGKVIVENWKLIEGYLSVNNNLEPINLIEWWDETPQKQLSGLPKLDEPLISEEDLQDYIQSEKQIIFKKEKQLTDEEIEALAEKEYPTQTEEEFYSVERDLDFMYYDYCCSITWERAAFIKGYKASISAPCTPATPSST